MITQPHDWRRTDLNDTWEARRISSYYASRNQSYVCFNCGRKAGRHYLSHRQGWKWTKNYSLPCKAKEAQAAYR